MNIVFVPKPPKGAQKRSVQNLNNSCDNTETARDRNECQLPLITNRKWHMGFRLIPTLMTLNDIDRRNYPYLAFFPPNSIALLTN